MPEEDKVKEGKQKKYQEDERKDGRGGKTGGEGEGCE